MTTLRPPTRKAVPARRARDVNNASTDSEGDGTQPSCSYKSRRGCAAGGEMEARHGTARPSSRAAAPGRLSECGPRLHNDAYFPCEQLRRCSSGSLSRRPGQSGAAGGYPSPATAEAQQQQQQQQRQRRGNASLSGAASMHDDPPSDESCLSPDLPCKTQKQKQKQLQKQHQEVQRHHLCNDNSLRGQSERRDPSHQSQPHRSLLAGQLPTCIKSAKRRAAEALLAARLGSGETPFAAPTASAAPLPPFPHHALAAASIDMHWSAGCTRALCKVAVGAVDVCNCAAAGAAVAVAQLGLGARRSMSCSSDAAPADDTASGGSRLDGSETTSQPTAAGTSRGSVDPPDAAGSARLSGLSALQMHVDRLAGPAAAGPQGTHQAAAGSRAADAVPRQPMQVPGPPPKRARLSLSAAAANSLGAGLSLGGGAPVGGTSARQQQQHKQQQGAGSDRAAATKVPSCDPGRCCKAKLQEAAVAMAGVAKRNGGSGAENGGGGAAAGEAAPAATEPAAVTGGVMGPGGAGASGSASGGIPVDPVWCSFEITLPHMNWQAVFDEPPGALQRFSIAKGYEKLVLPQGLVTYIVENERHVGDALRHLRAGMQDRLVAIDLEWRPETVAGRVSPVALLQLSSASVCLVVRTCCMGYGLPPALADFLTDPSVVLLGFGWDSADESKMRGTFGLGRADFRRFLDLQEVAASLGYHGFGLSRLSQQVLGLPLHKSKSISRSNWAAPQLTNHQLKYASLDVLVAGQLFRALRLWHSSPSPCADCRTPIGELILPGPLRCGNPDCAIKPATNLLQHRSHCAATGHPARYGGCNTCGRLYALPPPAEA